MPDENRTPPSNKQPDHATLPADHPPAESVASIASKEGVTTPLAQLRAGDMPTSKMDRVPLIFDEGDVLAGRYRVVRRLGRGGMGEVFAAEDLELGGTVALKTVLPEVAKDDQALLRFKREIQLARRVTHPNVCRTFDVFHHVVDNQRVAFVTMEYLEGETLTDRIRRQKKLSPEEALPLVAQMAAGLEAAHKAGIVHRDFKSANVMLVPSSDGSESRAVITDFGLAHVTDQDDASGVTSTGAVLGTPAYMAPEQVEGKHPTAAVDIYALGIVMYEMVTGTWPFTGGSAMSLAVRRLKEPAPSPRIHVPDLDPKWEQAILRCLEREPSRRFERVTDVVRSLEATPATPAPVPTPSRWNRYVLLAISLVVVAAALIMTPWLLRTRGVHAPTATAATPVKVRPAVTVLGFKNLTGNAEAAWLSGALGEMLTSELGANEKLRTISGESVGRLKRELNLPDTDALDKSTLARIRMNTGSDYVVLGSYFAPPKDDGVRVDLRLQETKRGETVGSIIVSGTQEGLVDLVSRAGAELRKKVGAGDISPAAAATALASLPGNTELARLYSEGLSRLRQFDALGARDVLERAAAVDPKYPLAHAALADAWAALGYDAKARQEAQTAFSLSGKLSREERLLTEAHLRLLTGEHDRAAEVFRSLHEFFPDNLDYGLGIAQAETDGGHAREALKTVDELRRLPSPLGDDPRLDIAEANAAEAIGDYKRELSATESGARKAVNNGATILLAKNLSRRGVALQRLGDPVKALQTFEQARSIYDGAGDQGGAARCLSAIGSVHVAEGKLAEAKQSYEAALAVHQRIGDDGAAAAALNNLAVVATQQGDLAQARALYEQALMLQRKIGDQKSESQTLTQLGSLSAATGDTRKARSLFDQALATGKAVGDALGVASVLGNLGNLAYSEGDLPDARRNYEEALTVARGSGVKTVIAGALSSLGTVNLDEGKLDEAARNYGEALQIATAAQDNVGRATALSNLALVQMWEGDLGAANRSFTDSWNLWKTIGDDTLMAYTLTDYTSMLLNSGDLAGAEARCREALAIRERLKDPAMTQNRVQLAIVSLERNQLRAAASSARAAAGVFAAAKSTDDEAFARAVNARALAGLPNRDAVGEARRALALISATTKVWARLSVMVAANRLLALNGETSAFGALEATRKTAAQQKFAGLELEARIAIAEANARERKGGDGALAALAAEAQRRGFLLLAKRAMTAMTPAS